MILTIEELLKYHYTSSDLTKGKFLCVITNEENVVVFLFFLILELNCQYIIKSNSSCVISRLEKINWKRCSCLHLEKILPCRNVRFQFVYSLPFYKFNEN